VSSQRRDCRDQEKTAGRERELGKNEPGQRVKGPGPNINWFKGETKSLVGGEVRRQRIVGDTSSERSAETWSKVIREKCRGHCYLVGNSHPLALRGSGAHQLSEKKRVTKRKIIEAVVGTEGDMYWGRQRLTFPGVLRDNQRARRALCGRLC